MKIIFLFFAALNIAFFLWQSNSMGHGTGDAQKYLVQDDSTPTLVLLHEANAAKNGESKPVQTAAVETPQNTGKKYAACYSLGPFDQVSLINSVSNQLRELGADISQRKETRKVVLGHWVYLPSFASWQEARKKVVELEKKGVKDIFVLGRGEMKNAVSLGLFKNEDSAKRRLDNLNKLGIKPKVETQHTQKDLIWLDVSAASNEQSVQTRLSTMVEENSGIQMQNRACGPP